MKTPVLLKESDIRIAGSVALHNGWDSALEFGLYAENFRAAARALVRELAADEVFMHSVSTAQSFRAYPAFYLYRHAFELAIKGVIVAAGDLLDYEGFEIDNKTLYQNHSFQQLRPHIERVFELIGWGWEIGIDGFVTVEDFRRLLSELDEFDATSTVCRYPVTKSGAPSMSKERCVNLFEFANTMEALLDLFSDVPSIVKHEVGQYFSYLVDVTGYE